MVLTMSKYWELPKPSLSDQITRWPRRWERAAGLRESQERCCDGVRTISCTQPGLAEVLARRSRPVSARSMMMGRFHCLLSTA